MKKRDFIELVGQKMRFISEKYSVDLELLKVEDLKPLPQEAKEHLNSMVHMKSAGISVREEPFSLMFLGPVDTPLSLEIHKVQCETLDKFEISVSPVHSDEKGIYYQAVFH